MGHPFTDANELQAALRDFKRTNLDYFYKGIELYIFLTNLF